MFLDPLLIGRIERGAHDGFNVFGCEIEEHDSEKAIGLRKNPPQ
jgi:hypothetical protein